MVFKMVKMFISHSSIKVYVVGLQISRHICVGCSENPQQVFRSVVKKIIVLLDFWNCDMHARIQRGGGGEQGSRPSPPPPEKSQNIDF